MYKNIRTSRRLRKSSKNIPFVCLTLISFHVVVLVSWLFILILLSGNIELNPGPYSVDGSADTSDILSSTSFDSLTNHLSILHLNIQSILPKIDLIRGKTTSYDILIFSESWLKPTVNNHEIRIENFMPPYRTDRNDRPGGGVIVYVRDTLIMQTASGFGGSGSRRSVAGINHQIQTHSCRGLLQASKQQP